MNFLIVGCSIGGCSTHMLERELRMANCAVQAVGRTEPPPLVILDEKPRLESLQGVIASYHTIGCWPEELMILPWNLSAHAVALFIRETRSRIFAVPLLRPSPVQSRRYQFREAET